ncbi:MAG: VWA domain-containing protein, partial [Actinobacteria bacterium]
EEVATEGGVVMLALDTSLSMEADDVAPSRIDAAQEAAATFLESVPEGVRIGVVGFAGTAQVLLDPTDDTAAVQRTIDRIQLGEGTAIGEAVFSALDVFANLDGDDEDDGDDDVVTGADAVEPAEGDALTGAVVLLSDGETTQGRTNDEAAKAALAQGVAVNTIAFGTDAGVVTGPDGVQIPVPVNRDALRALADETGGRYFPAYTEAELKQVYEKLGESVETETVHREVTDWFTFAAMALALLAGIGSLTWFSRLP